jgi:hypothetical protein
MKKFTVVLSIAVSLLFIFTFALNNAKAEPPGGNDDCECQSNSEDANGVAFCLWNGVYGEFCTVAGCATNAK